MSTTTQRPSGQRPSSQRPSTQRPTSRHQFGAAGRRRAAPFPASPTTRSITGDVLVTLAGLGLGVVVAIELLTRTSLGGPGALLTEAGRWTALVGTYASLLLLVLVARVPLLERSVGMDRLMRWHRVLGPVALLLVGAHVVLVTAGYAADASMAFLAQSWSFLTTYSWMPAAVVGFALMVLGGVTSWRVARRRMKYETWWVTHLYFYLAIALAYLHQVMYGQQFVDHDWARMIWIGMYVGTAALLLVFRVGSPIIQSLRMDLRVHAVQRESHDTVSVWIAGRGVDRFALRGGQFFGFRFLTRDGWWQSHPYSVSVGSSPQYLRITVKDLGDHSRSMANLRTGTRVVVEGPYGIFTADNRVTDRVVLVGGGVGVTPVRAILDDLPDDVQVDFLYRAHRTEDLVLRTELEKIAAARHGTMRLRYLVGSRRDYPINAKTLQHLVPDIASCDVYACGPAALVDAVVEATQVLGMPDSQVHHEAFSFHSPDTYAFERATKES